ncbi:MAG: ethanolamine ammonia-lyase reactivating factor EutA [Acidobacteria bacterium]|nr:ethanolamine ammonia-lyase reactivating factor EutA [Acidobacteriota bacterium]
MHDFEIEHTHYDQPLSPEESAARWGPELVVLNSVGVDIGSSTSHVIVSRLGLRRRGQTLSSRFEVVTRDIIYHSPILLTPYAAPYLIDAAALARFLNASYQEAGVQPSEIDTGAVIITGEAMRKENAPAIVELFAAEGGKFVCAVAGHKLEAVLAAHGSGAVEETLRKHRTILNVDIGGGTAKVAVVHGGAVRDVAAINVGARLLACDADGTITRLEPSLAPVLRHIGVPLELGRVLDPAVADRIADTLVDALFEVLERRPLSAVAESLMLTPPLGSVLPFNTVTFTGGVAEYIYGRQPREFGDLGRRLARRVRERAERSADIGRIGEPPHKLHATVIGASQHTVQLSGSTIFCPRPDLLPLRNLSVVSPIFSRKRFTREAIGDAIRHTLDRVELLDAEQPFALAVRWVAEPSYANLREFAEGLRDAAPKTLDDGTLALVFDRDLAQSVGQLLTTELGVRGNLVCLDEVELKPFDTIDIGAPAGRTRAVPVVIKSMVFA